MQSQYLAEQYGKQSRHMEFDALVSPVAAIGTSCNAPRERMEKQESNKT